MVYKHNCLDVLSTYVYICLLFSSRWFSSQPLSSSSSLSFSWWWWWEVSIKHNDILPMLLLPNFPLWQWVACTPPPPPTNFLCIKGWRWMDGCRLVATTKRLNGRTGQTTLQLSVNTHKKWTIIISSSSLQDIQTRIFWSVCDNHGSLLVFCIHSAATHDVRLTTRALSLGWTFSCVAWKKSFNLRKYACLCIHGVHWW